MDKFWFRLNLPTRKFLQLSQQYDVELGEWKLLMFAVYLWQVLDQLLDIIKQSEFSLLMLK